MELRVWLNGAHRLHWVSKALAVAELGSVSTLLCRPMTQTLSFPQLWLAYLGRDRIRATVLTTRRKTLTPKKLRSSLLSREFSEAIAGLRALSVPGALHSRSLGSGIDCFVEYSYSAFRVRGSSFVDSIEGQR